MKKILILTITCLISINSYSQNKFGHVNSQELIQALPGTETALDSLQDFEKQAQRQLQQMEMLYQQSLQEYQENLETYDPLVKQDKEAELLSLQQRMQIFGQNAQEKYQKLELDLITPLQEKVKKAITEVAIEGNYTYIFDKNLSGILYSKESESIMEKVKKKLNL